MSEQPAQPEFVAADTYAGRIQQSYGEAFTKAGTKDIRRQMANVFMNKSFLSSKDTQFDQRH